MSPAQSKTAQSKTGSIQAAADKADDSRFAIAPRITAALLLIGGLVFGCGTWAATASLSGAVIASGSVVVERHAKKVQHRDGGIVAAINVRNGERVLAGATLIRLDDTQTRAELAIVRSQLVELSGRKVRLLAERDGRETLQFAPEFAGQGSDSANVEAGETRLFNENVTTRKSQKEQLQLRIGQLGEERGGLTRQRDAKAHELQLIRKELEQVQSLQKRALTPISRVYAMEREATRLDGEHGALLSQIARIGGQISELNLQILAVDQTARAEAQRELRSIEARLAELAEREGAARDRLGRMELKSPQTGIVHELAVNTIGGVVTAAEPVMLIVPDGEALTVEARMSPLDIDQLSVGQGARLRFSAFNSRATEELAGHIIHVAADTTTDAKSGQTYYSTRIALADEARAKLGDLKLIPGMPVEVFVATADRTALDYLAKPFLDQLARAFREE